MRAIIASLLLILTPALGDDVAPPVTTLRVISMDYPEMMLQMQQEAEIRVHLAVASDGFVTSVAARSGSSYFARPAEQNARQWLFPAGSARELDITYEFKLREPRLPFSHSVTTFDFQHATVTVLANRLQPQT